MYKSFEICNSHAYGGSFLREPSMACNINGIGIANSKKYNAVNKDSTRLLIKLSTGFAMPQFVLYCTKFLYNNLGMQLYLYIKYICQCNLDRLRSGITSSLICLSIFNFKTVKKLRSIG